MTISLSSFSSHDFIYFEQNTQMSLLNEMKPRIQGSDGSAVDLFPSLTRTGLHLPVSLLSSAGVPALRGEGAAAPLPSASLGRLGWGRKWQTEDTSLLLCGCVQTTPHAGSFCSQTRLRVFALRTDAKTNLNAMMQTPKRTGERVFCIQVLVSRSCLLTQHVALAES